MERSDMKVLRDIRAELEPTTAAVASAHDAGAGAAMDGSWARLGLLQRLVRVDDAEPGDERPDARVAA
jgi:hypothetical protein